MNVSASDGAAATVAQLLEFYSPRQLAAMLSRTGGAGREEFLSILYDDLLICIKELEAQAHRCQEDGEEKLTNYLAIQLRRLSYNATCEPDDRGHVDLEVECAKCHTTWKAEAKLHASHEKNADGLRQLMDRYSSGRDSDAGFLLYLRDQANSTLIIKRWRAKIAKEALCDALRCEDVKDALGFASVHRHAVGTEIRVVHFPVLLYYKPTDNSAQGKKA